MGAIVNGKRLGNIFGVTPRTVSDWRKAGMPVHEDKGRGKGTLYDTEEAFRWLLARDGTGGKDSGTVAARRRLLEIEADRRAIHLARERGEVVAIADVSREWEGAIMACRSRLLLIPTTVSPQVAGLSAGEAFQILQDRIYEALDELAGDKETKEGEAQ